MWATIEGSPGHYRNTEVDIQSHLGDPGKVVPEGLMLTETKGWVGVRQLKSWGGGCPDKGTAVPEVSRPHSVHGWNILASQMRTSFQDEIKALSKQRPREACSGNANSLKKPGRFHVDTEEPVALDPHALKTAGNWSGCRWSLDPGWPPRQGRQPTASYCPSRSGTSSAVPSSLSEEVNGSQAEKLGTSHSARRSHSCCVAAGHPLLSADWRGSPPSRIFRSGLSYPRDPRDGWVSGN